MEKGLPVPGGSQRAACTLSVSLQQPAAQAQAMLAIACCFSVWCTKEVKSKSLPGRGRQICRCSESNEHGDHCSVPFTLDPLCSCVHTDPSFTPASTPLHGPTPKLVLMPERELQGAGEKALIKNGSCPFSSSKLFCHHLISYYQSVFHFLLLFNWS